ncbi:MAG: cupin domain-containing protein [Halobacteriales archaeon]
MGYAVIDPDGIEPTPDRPSVQRALDEAAGLEHVALKLYEPEPGEQIPLVYHVHETQEEAFYVAAGRIVVETPEGAHEVAENELFVAEPGSPHRAYVPEDAAPARVLALGAPPVSGDGRRYEPDDGPKG